MQERNSQLIQIQVPGRFDGINFNYQIMTIFDLIRVMYYQKYIENVPTNH